ncbi:hypothetical protein Tco_1384001 [Tanacetum coccineum]
MLPKFRLAKRLTWIRLMDLFYYLQQFEKLVNVSRAKKLEKSHDPLALVAHTGSSSRNTSSYYVTHPTSVVDYEDEYQQDDVHTNSEDPLASAMLLLARAITQNFSTLTNNRLRTSSNTRNQAIIQCTGLTIQSILWTLRTSSLGNTSTVQCYNFMWKMTMNCWTIDYAQINALYKDFVPQKELSAEQKYFPSSFIPSDKNSNATPSIPASMPNQLKPIVNELQFYFEFFKTLFQRDIKEMKDVFESTESELCELEKQNDFLKD